MNKLHSFLLLLCLMIAPIVSAEVVTTVPAIIQQGSTGIEVTFNAKEGNGALSGITGIYAHAGVITNKSANDGDWKYAPIWLDNSAKYKLKFAGSNKWKLTIGDIRTFYGISDPTEVVKKLAFVFRNADGTKEGKTADGQDILVTVHADGLAVNLTSNAAGSIINSTNNVVTFNANTSQAADIKLFINSTSSTPIASVSGATTLSTTYTFPQGDFDIIAQATVGGETKEDVVTLCHRGNSQQVNYNGTLKNGATVNPDGTVTFTLNAPNKSNVLLVGEWNDYKPTNATLMNYQGNKIFWVNVPGLDMNKEYAYYFIVDDNISVADPYAKLILDPWNDKYINQNYMIYPDLKPFPTKVGNVILAVFKGNDANYNWEIKDFKAPAKENLIIYEMLIRDFTDERSIGAAMAKLDYIKNLGVNAIELMPIQEFDGNDSWGYNPNFYFAPDKAYGTKEAYKKFIDECHKRGMAVIIDVVFNHSWGQHPWCKMYWDAANNRPTADSPFQNAEAPHNWSVGNDWKQENVVVQEYFCDVLKYWIEEYKVDGYRFDLVKGLGATSSYGGDYDGSRHNDSRIGIMNKYHNAIKSANPNAYAIYEAFVAASEENEYAKSGAMSWRNKNGDYCETAMGFQRSFSGMFTGDDGRPFGSTVGFMESHDEERAAFHQNEFGMSGVKGNVEMSMRRLGANAAMGLLVPGAKMIWQFGEMGYDVSIDYNGRTGTKPTHWEYLDNQYRKGLADSYSEMLNIRKANPELFSSQAEFYWSPSEWDNGRFITARNRTANKELVVAYNPFANERTFDYNFNNGIGGTYYINSKTYNTSPSINTSNGKITVPAHSYVLITNMSDPSGVSDAIVDGNEDMIRIYPNPTTSSFTVNADAVKQVDVYSITGSLVLSVEGENNIDVSNLSNGNYIVRITTETNVATKKLIKK